MMNLDKWLGHWIWSSDDSLPQRNAHVQFRRRFHYSDGPATLHLTADSRYSLFLNGQYLGHGPVRAWPNHYRYDSYDLEPQLRQGENVLAVVVNHFGEGTFQYLPAPAGLLAQLEIDGETIASDSSWLARPEPALRSIVPRISVQEGFEEQFDARLSDEWTEFSYDDSQWQNATELRGALDGPHRNLEPRGIPFLTLEPVLPQRIVTLDQVRSVPHRFTIYAKPYLTPNDFNSNFVHFHAFLATQIWSPAPADITLISPHKRPGPILVNGQQSTDSPSGSQPQPERLSSEMTVSYASLQQGWNNVLISLPHSPHLAEFTIAIDGPTDLKFSARGETDGGAAWAVVGPFELTEADYQAAHEARDKSYVLAEPLHQGATTQQRESLAQSGDVASIINEPWFQLVAAEHQPLDDAFLMACTDLATEGKPQIENIDALLSGADWTIIHPSPNIAAVR